MKILFFTRSFYPHVGGVEKHIWEVSLRLIKLGHEVIVVTEESKNTVQRSKQLKANSANSPELIQGITTYRIPIATNEKQKKYTVWKWLWQHQELLKYADIIHAHDVFYWYLPFRFLYPHKKIFTTFHGYETVYPPRANAIRIRKLSKLLSLGTINVGDYIEKWYGTSADIVTYGGAEGKRKEEVYSRNRALKIVFIGRIEEDTGCYVYEEVLNILTTNNTEFEFTALGDGSLRKNFERYGKVLGFVSETEKYVKKADLVFASSYLSLLETFSLKKTVIAVYQNPLKKDYLLMTPFRKWICASANAMELAHEIIAFWHDRKKYNELQDEAYEWVKTQTWEHLMDQYLTLWSKQK